jgi:transcriptional regulator with XRE-family HTH domain
MQAARINSQGTIKSQRLRLLLMAAAHVERIGTRIRERREELGLSRRKLVQRMEGVVTENDIYRWERGQHRPNDQTLDALAKALEVDVSYFLVEAPQKPVPDLLHKIGGDLTQLDRLEQALAQIDKRLSRLEDELRRRAIEAPTPELPGELGRYEPDDADTPANQTRRKTG